MPLIKKSAYTIKPFYFFNEHFETIIPSAFFKDKSVIYTRKRIELSDGDFLDLDWITNHSSRLMIITHGLEGNSERFYVKRTAKYFAQRGWDILCWNCRSCSGEMNRLPRFYHHGDTQDLMSVIEFAIKENSYNEIILLGYSMGGSMSIKLLGEFPDQIKEIKGAVTFSVPCNLRDSAIALSKPNNKFYEKRFLKKLIIKIKQKNSMHPDILDVNGIDKLTSFEEFHQNYTVPLHGFESIEDFYLKATCDQYLPHLRVPVLTVNALNDPLLQDGCYPFSSAAKSDLFFLETPKYGGHVGFNIPYTIASWMETRAEQFIKQQIFNYRT